MMTANRANRAEDVLADANYGGDFEEAITDLVTDLYHLADREGINWTALLGRVDMHHDAEVNGED
jgi:hypothetical protein